MAVEVQVNNSYELYQIITDFGNPLEIFREAFQNAIDENATEVFCNVYEKPLLGETQLIIDIWNNGEGLTHNMINCFFDVANSSKINEDMTRKEGKLGYKGHGAKIFFNSERVQICSKGNGYYWAAQLDKPIVQIRETNKLVYDESIDTKDIELPNDWDTGFFVRIINPLSFSNEHTKFKLNHLYLRDYIRWYTVFGSINTVFDEELGKKNIKLFLRGLNIEQFKQDYPENDIQKMDPPTKFDYVSDKLFYEEIPLGHYFPSKRTTDKEMKNYVKNVSGKKQQYYEYYSNMMQKTIDCGSFSFRFIISIEGYETKRKYDVLLSRRGKRRENEIGIPTHNDAERYGIWACIGGIPVEKVDDWIEGGKGTYTYIQAFVDCDKFSLTANRGSIRNTNIETLEIIKSRISEEFNSDTIQRIIKERSEIEELEKITQSVKEDEKDLNKRFTTAQKRKKIIITRPDNTTVTLLEPTKSKYWYSESETMVILLRLMEIYPDLFSFKILDYNTYKGIDFVIDDRGYPKYIELKGTLSNKMNHPLSLISKVICYDYNLNEGDSVIDNNQTEYTFKTIKNDTFISNSDEYNGKQCTGLTLKPENTANYSSVQVLSLKKLLEEVIEAKFE